MTTGRPPMSRRTKSASRSSVPPSPRRTSWRGRTGGRSSGAGASGRYASTRGRSAMMPGSMGRPGYMGGRFHADPSMPPAWSWDIPAGARSASGAWASRSWASIRLLGERPRSTRRPSRSVALAEASAVIRIRNLLKAIRPRALRPLPTGPRRITGSSVGVVAQATYASNGPSWLGSGRPVIQAVRSDTWLPSAVTVTPKGPGTRPSSTTPQASRAVAVACRSKQKRSVGVCPTGEASPPASRAPRAPAEQRVERSDCWGASAPTRHRQDSWPGQPQSPLLATKSRILSHASVDELEVPVWVPGRMFHNMSVRRARERITTHAPGRWP